MRERALGLMSGTSQDGIDAALAEFEDGRFAGLIATHTGQYPADLRQELLALGFEDQPLSLARYAALDRAVADAFANTALELLAREGLKSESVTVLGSHGQTVFHDPRSAGNSLQIGDPSRIAARTGIATAADFRRKDIALGGEGAPLVPAFHHALFADAHEPRAVLNLGGIANLSLLPDANPLKVRGFDTGPANGLMDEWVQAHRGQRYDADGVWAASGQLHQGLLDALLAEPYFAASIPKSTGRGQFRLPWVRARWPQLDALPLADVQRTLCELTARSAIDALRAHQPQTRRLLVCGGGALNGFLMQRLAALAADIGVQGTGDFGLHADWVEAAAFAWLGLRRWRGEPGSLAAVTGASRATVLGGLFLP